MSEGLQTDPIELRMTSASLCTAAEDHASGTARHREDFTDAVERWRGGGSRVALQAIAERWETRHAERQQHVNRIGQQVNEAANRFVTADDGSSEAISSVPVLGSDPGSPDVGLRL